jgi:hypothetical protein
MGAHPLRRSTASTPKRCGALPRRSFGEQLLEIDRDIRATEGTSLAIENGSCVS